MVLYFHGYVGTLVHRLNRFLWLDFTNGNGLLALLSPSRLWRLERAPERSAGRSPTRAAAYALVVARSPASRIAVSFGESLGTGRCHLPLCARPSPVARVLLQGALRSSIVDTVAAAS